MPEGIGPNVIHHERVADIVVSTAVVQLPDIEGIQRCHDIHVAVAVQAERIQRAVGNFIQRVTIGIGRLELETTVIKYDFFMMSPY
ncbi:MAG TPA: hypothetical protein VFO46_12270 [Candidatus Sulfotelmatobacter sp.]|nr:hypothetical protein [Candidatus Sulfotelmatobacter sp.]